MRMHVAVLAMPQLAFNLLSMSRHVYPMQCMQKYSCVVEYVQRWKHRNLQDSHYISTIFQRMKNDYEMYK